jgi:predicted ArsR family transcriptional regulator
VKTDEARTRDRVARVILESGPQTAAVIAERLALTPAAVRRHLDGLVEFGLLEARDPYISDSRGRGRPAKVFVLTENGRERFEQAYDDLAISALRYLETELGDEAVAQFATSRALEFMKRHPVPPDSDRLQVVAEALTEEGYAATVQEVLSGHELCQHHCPVAHVATAFPQICEAETAALSTMLGTHVQRLATIAHGDGVCTTFVPDPARIRKTGKTR